MSPFALARKTVGATLRRRATAVVLLLLLTGAGLVTDGVVRQFLTSPTPLSTGIGLRLVEVRSRDHARDLTAADISRIRAVPHVKDVLLDVSVPLAIESDSTKSLADFAPVIWVHPYLQGYAPGECAGCPDPPGPGQVILPRDVGGADLTGLLGKRFTATLQVSTGPGTATGSTTTLTAAGTYPAPTGSYEPQAAFASWETVSRLAAASAGMPVRQWLASMTTLHAQAFVDAPEHVSAVESHLRGLGFDTISAGSGLSALPRMVQLIHTAGLVLTAGALLAMLLLGWAVGSTWTIERRSDIGILRCQGWPPQRVLAWMAQEIAGVGLVIGLGGLTAGCALSLALQHRLAGNDVFGIVLTNPVPPSGAALVVSAAGPPLTLLAASALPLLKAAFAPPLQILHEPH